jgi:hypothetical protein
MQSSCSNRPGRSSAAEADIAAAKKIDPEIER